MEVWVAAVGRGERVRRERRVKGRWVRSFIAMCGVDNKVRDVELESE